MGTQKQEAPFTPLHDRVIVRRDKADDTSKGGLVIPSTAQQPMWSGTVIAAGEGKFFANGERKGLDVKAGDRILIGAWKGEDITFRGENLLILREDHILAIVE